MTNNTRRHIGNLYFILILYFIDIDNATRASSKVGKASFCHRTTRRAKGRQG